MSGLPIGGTRVSTPATAPGRTVMIARDRHSLPERGRSSTWRCDRVRHFLRHRRKLHGRGTRSIYPAMVFGALGVLQTLIRIKKADNLTTFGTITIDGKTYEHDVIIRRSGEVVKRKKKLSKKYYGT